MSNSVELELAMACDLANKWARESGVAECRDPYSPYGLSTVIDRLWAHNSSVLSKLRSDNDALTTERVIAEPTAPVTAMAESQSPPSVVGHLLFAGDNTVRDTDGALVSVPRSLVIQFADDESIRRAIANRKCEFILLETPEE